MATITTDLGVATAYGYAKSTGYTGTEEQFAELMASYASVAEAAAQSASDAADSATNAHNSEVAAQGYAGTAQTKAGEAANSATSASGSAGTATNKAAAASDDALKAEGYAVGEQNGAAVASSSPYYQNNAEYYRDKAVEAKNTAESVAASIPPDYSALSAEVLSMFPIDTATGAVASFADGADGVPVADLTVEITPFQTGSGDPAPDNVRPISGWTGANVYVSPTTNAADGTTYPVTFPSEAGTVYGGTVDVTTGKLTVTHALNTLDGTQHLEPNGTLGYGGIQVRYDPSPAKAYGDPDSYSDIKCNRFKPGATDAEGEINGRTSAGFVVIDMPADVTTADAATTWVANNNTQIWYKLATPVTYQLTPTEVKTLLGINNVWADSGDSTVNYRADIQKYINKVIAAAIAAI